MKITPHPYERQVFARIGDHPVARAMISGVLNASTGFTARESEINSSSSLTEVGKMQARNEALQFYLKEACRAKRSLQKFSAESNALRARMKVKPIDRTDLVGAIEREGIRTWLRSMSIQDRMALMTSTSDPQMIETMLAHPERSGLSGSNFAPLLQIVTERYLEENFGDEMRAKAAIDAVAVEATGAAKLALDEIRRAAGLNEVEFNRLLEPIEKQYGAPWLLKDGDRTIVCEVTADGKANYRPASTDEIADGVFYQSAQAYAEARASA